MKKIRRYVYDPNGRRRWYSAETEKKAALKKVKLEKEIAKASLVDSRITFREWTEKWRDIYRADESAPSRKQNAARLERYVMPFIGARTVVSIKPLDLQRIFSRTSSLSYSFNHKLYITLGQIFSAAIDNDIIIKSPLRGVKKPKGRNGSNRSLTEEEYARVLACVGNDSDDILVMLCLFCGLRPQEAAALTWRDIDLKKRRISIDKALKSDGVIGAPKSSAGVRSIPIPDELLRFLKTRKGSGYVCKNRSGDPLSSTTIRQAWARFRRRASLPSDLPLYTLRHTYCTRLETAGVPINLARLFMGHESIKITAGIYTHTEEEAVESALLLINRKNEHAV